MSDPENSVGVRRIEQLFAQNIEYASGQKSGEKKSVFRRFRTRHVLWVPQLLVANIYRLLPKILKDIFFCFSIIHKSPASKFFARTRYDEFRILIDAMVTSLALKAVPEPGRSCMKNTFESGFYTTNILDVSGLDSLIDDVLKYSSPSHAGARPYFKDGKNEKIDGSYSAYFTFSKDDNRRANEILRQNLTDDFDHHLSALAGYKCKLEDITYTLSVVCGANSNDEMHQDTYGSVAKGFLYLQDIGAKNAPFEYLEGSYVDAKFRSRETNNAVLADDFHSSGSTRLRGQALESALEEYQLRSFTGSKGLFVLANTAGYHRKGEHNSEVPRIILACGVKRRGVFSKLIINSLASFKPIFCRQNYNACARR